MGEFNARRESRQLIAALERLLRHSFRANNDCRIIIDETGTRMTAILPPCGHEKLSAIIAELKKPREYEPPAPPAAKPKFLNEKFVCNFAKQDVRALARQISMRAKISIGFDFENVPTENREAALALGETITEDALLEFAAAAGLGEVIVEENRSAWILGREQNARLIDRTGKLPWQRAVVRSYYIEPAVEQFGVNMIFDEIRAAAPADWGGSCPVAIYHEPTGRLIVLHDEHAQNIIGRVIDERMRILQPERRTE